MFDIGYSELLLIAVVALVVIGPKDLPRVMRMVGGWVGKGRAMTRHVRAGFDTMMRESELEEMEKKWREHNDAIMRAYPTIDGALSPVPAAAQIVDNVVVPGPPMTATTDTPIPAHVEPTPAYVERSRDTIDKTETKPAGETA